MHCIVHSYTRIGVNENNRHGTHTCKRTWTRQKGSELDSDRNGLDLDLHGKDLGMHEIRLRWQEVDYSAELHVWIQVQFYMSNKCSSHVCEQNMEHSCTAICVG